MAITQNTAHRLAQDNNVMFKYYLLTAAFILIMGKAI